MADDDQSSGPQLADPPGGDNTNFPASGQSRLIGTAQRTWTNKATGETTSDPPKPLYGRSIPKSQF